MRKMNLICLSLLSLISLFGWGVAYTTEKQMDVLRDIQMKNWMKMKSIDGFSDDIKEHNENLEKKINDLNEERVE